MVVLDKYLDDNDLSPDASAEVDLPPSYDTIASSSEVSRLPVDEKPWPTTLPVASHPTASSSTSTAGSWFSLLPSARTKQTRQTVLSLIRDLVASTSSPSSDIPDSSAAAPILASCASVLSPSSFSALLQDPTFEGHTALYWVILNRHIHILPQMLRYAGPLNRECVADVRLACLASSDQILFGKLRRGELPFVTGLRVGQDAFVLGSTSADDIDVHEVDGEAAFSAGIKIPLWQKRMRVAGVVGLEFIARGRIWSLTFFSSPSPTISSNAHSAGSGPWQVALSLMEHSSPTFVDGRLVINVSCTSSGDSVSSPIHGSSPSLFPPRRVSHLSHVSSSAHQSIPSMSTSCKCPAQQPLTILLKSPNRLAHRRSDGSLMNVLELGRITSPSSSKHRRPPGPTIWSEEGTHYTNALIGELGDDLGWDNTPYLTPDGTLHARLDARLEKAEGGSCIIC
ncbi:hypothetical protein K503DRAFT_776346 [Rhizopogon vinicolor AM-OR11-026]|uniref:Uncharacterized protein n=1 Tax=Rhizopogon vinicolor AM-OR11-026 TaxID=1314800 RepID=A0A1B7MJF6_9AGAM|nr:hypothetical protein K503DRAFT_776346 [Rhizopogon vinicolor AM-OR11-026]